jgi:hypothetical protein
MWRDGDQLQDQPVHARPQLRQQLLLRMQIASGSGGDSTEICRSRCGNSSARSRESAGLRTPPHRRARRHPAPAVDRRSERRCSRATGRRFPGLQRSPAAGAGIRVVVRIDRPAADRGADRAGSKRRPLRSRQSRSAPDSDSVEDIGAISHDLITRPGGIAGIAQIDGFPVQTFAPRHPQQTIHRIAPAGLLIADVLKAQRFNGLRGGAIQSAERSDSR